MADNLMASYAQNPPMYVVMVGDFAFNLRDRIVKEWGAVPMLLFAKTSEILPIEQYFNEDMTNVGKEDDHKLSQYQKDYNFTAVISEDCYEETIDLMMKMIPDMNKFVFCSDSVFVNNILAEKISRYVQSQYPNVSYTWLKANSKNAETLRGHLVDRDPKLGMLMSSWNYSVRYPNGSEYLNPSDVMLISASKNPVFTMRKPYMDIGAVGGVYTDIDAEKEKMLEYVDSMLAGADMSKLPFYINDSIRPTLNYPGMQGYGLSEQNAPDDTELLMR